MNLPSESAPRALKYAPLARAEQGEERARVGIACNYKCTRRTSQCTKNERKRRLFVIYTRDHEESSSSMFVRSDNTAGAVTSA